MYMEGELHEITTIYNLNSCIVIVNLHCLSERLLYIETFSISYIDFVSFSNILQILNIVNIKCCFFSREKCRFVYCLHLIGFLLALSFWKNKYIVDKQDFVSELLKDSQYMLLCRAGTW